MPPAFDLHFQPIESRRDVAIGLPPALSLSVPKAGRILFQIGRDNSPLIIQMSSLYPPFVSIWTWSVAIAHRMLPVSVRIDGEGGHTDLCAETENIGGLLLTIRQVDANGVESKRRVWREARLGWLKRIGDVFGPYLEDSFDRKEWLGGTACWPEPAQYLPWRWPHSVGLIRSSDESSWPQSALRIWFFLIIARHLHPAVLQINWHPEGEEAFVRLRYLLTLLQREALAQGCAEMSDSARPCSSNLLDQAILNMQELLDELEMSRETGMPTRPELTDQEWLNRSLLQAAFSFESEFHSFEQAMTKELFKRLPLTQGTWFVDELGRSGCLMCIDGQRMVIDWGEIGITSEDGFHCGYRTTWCWPVTEPYNFVFPDESLFQRWRLFASSPQTSQFLICPCCGYPNLEEEPEEIRDCPLCGWPLYFMFHNPLPRLDQPLYGYGSDWPSLRESRQHFTTHGDVFAPEDSNHACWLRRDDVIVLRKHVIAQFDNWLADPLRNNHLLPMEDWRRLEWMPREALDSARVQSKTNSKAPSPRLGRKHLKCFASGIAHMFACSAEHYALMAHQHQIQEVKIDLFSLKTEPIEFNIKRNRILAGMCQRSLFRNIEKLNPPGSVNSAVLIAHFGIDDYSKDNRGVSSIGEFIYSVILTDDRGKEWRVDTRVERQLCL